MPLSRPVLEAQLQRAEAAMNKLVSALKTDKVEESAFGLNPVWRSLNADCKQIRRRLRALTETETITAELAARKSAEEAE